MVSWPAYCGFNLGSKSRLLLLLCWRETLFDERAGLSYTVTAGPRQRNNSCILVPRDLWPYFTVSDSRLPQPGGLGPRIYISQKEGGPVILSTNWVLFSSSPMIHRWRYSNPLPRGLSQLQNKVQSQRQSYIMTDGQSVGLGWCQAPIWGWPNFYYHQTVAGLLKWGALSDDRTGLYFTVAAGPRQRSLSGVRVPRDLWPSDLRLSQPRGPGSRIYFPRKRVTQIYPKALGSKPQSSGSPCNIPGRTAYKTSISLLP
jgi:hypothetical protein